jgi:hypothetical protein
MTSVGLFSEKITGNKLLTVSSPFLGLITRHMKIRSTGSDTNQGSEKTIEKNQTLPVL